MTTAFLAEVDTSNGTRYVGKNGKLQKLPIFYAASSRLKDVFKSTRRSHYPTTNFDWYLSQRDVHLTRVVIVDNVENGLKASIGSNLSVVEFLAKEFSTSGKYAPKKPHNAVFKIRVRHGTSHRYAGGGKFGKTWERQGDLRLHITSNLSRLTVKHNDPRVPYYKDAEVVMIELDADGFTPTKVTRTPVLEFYLQSPNCKKRWDELHRSSLASFNGDLAKVGPFA